MRVTYVLEIDKARLDEYVRELYDGPEYDDPVLGEPTPGRHLAVGWIEETRHTLAEGHAPDNLWWTDETVTSLEIDCDSPCFCEVCRAQ